MQEETTKKHHFISGRLRGLRSRRGLSQGDLAAKLGVTPGSVGNWESNKNGPGPGPLKKIADFFGVSTEFFYGDEAPYPPQIKAGDVNPISETRYGEEHYYSSGRNLSEFGCPDKAAYALEWFGDSMEPQFRSGDLIVVSPNSVLQAGDVVVAKLTDDTLMLRVYHRKPNDDNCIILSAYNSMVYPTLEYGIEDFRLLHPVWSSIRSLKKRGLVPKEHQGERKKEKDETGEESQ